MDGGQRRRHLERRAGHQLRPPDTVEIVTRSPLSMASRGARRGVEIAPVHIVGVGLEAMNWHRDCPRGEGGQFSMFSRPAQGAAAHGRASRRFGVAGDLFLEPLEHLARHDFGLELLDALRQLADIGRLRDAGCDRARTKATPISSP